MACRFSAARAFVLAAAAVAAAFETSHGEQCQDILKSMEKRNDFEVRALCRAQFPLHVCAQAKELLGAHPWANDRIQAACGQWVATWPSDDAARVLRAATKAEQMEDTATEKPSKMGDTTTEKLPEAPEEPWRLPREHRSRPWDRRHTRERRQAHGPVMEGCFKDNSNRAFNEGLLRVGRDESTIMKCAAHCSGKLFMAIQNYDECFCGNLYETGSSYQQVPTTDCSAPCPVLNGCGGPWRNSVYKLQGSNWWNPPERDTDTLQRGLELTTMTKTTTTAPTTMMTRTATTVTTRTATTATTRTTTMVTITTTAARALPANRHNKAHPAKWHNKAHPAKWHNKAHPAKWHKRAHPAKRHKKAHPAKRATATTAAATVATTAMTTTPALMGMSMNTSTTVVAAHPAKTGNKHRNWFHLMGDERKATQQKFDKVSGTVPQAAACGWPALMAAAGLAAAAFTASGAALALRRRGAPYGVPLAGMVAEQYVAVGAGAE